MFAHKPEQITLDNLDVFLAGVKKNKDEIERFINEAIACGARITNDYDTIHIEVRDSRAEVKENGYGLIMSVYNYETKVHTWLAIEDSYGIRDAYHSGEYDMTIGFKAVIDNAFMALDTCDYCNKPTGLKNMTRVAFCNKSCPDCLEKARARDEQPGWYN